MLAALVTRLRNRNASNAFRARCFARGSLVAPKEKHSPAPYMLVHKPSLSLSCWRHSLLSPSLGESHSHNITILGTAMAAINFVFEILCLCGERHRLALDETGAAGGSKPCVPFADHCDRATSSSGSQRKPWRYSQLLPSKRIAPRLVPNQITPGSPAATVVKSSSGRPSRPVNRLQLFASRRPAPCGLANQSRPAES